MGQQFRSACTHIEVWASRLTLSDRGALTPDTPPRSVLKNMDGPRGSAEEFDKVFLKTC
jgi:hypothetical protein